MQLPRGTFREIKKHTKFGVLFEELQQTRFSGICILSLGKVNGIIVFKSGKRILAEYENCIGDVAWEELQKIVDETVDAALSTLDAAQIELSIEFNKSCRILNIGKAEHPPPLTILPTQPQGVKEYPLHTSESIITNRSVTVESHHIKESSIKAGHTHSAKSSHKHSFAVSPQSKGYTQSTEKKEISQEENSSLEETASRDIDKDIDTFKAMDPEAVSNFDQDIDNFETMDLEFITNKIRGECKDIIKQLNLEYLKEN